MPSLTQNHQEAAPREERYKQLLQPVKDIAKAWNIDITDLLQQYTDELDEIVKRDEAKNVNFSEGALIVQNATNIYGRKVETLYDQVYKSLEQLVTRKGARNGNGKNRKQSALTEDFDTDYLVDISDYIKIGKNISLEEEDLYDPNKELTLRRVPLWLMPREESDRRKKEFKISSCTVHPSGTFLLLEQDMNHCDLPHDDMEADIDCEPLCPAPPQLLTDLQEQVDSLNEEFGLDELSGGSFGSQQGNNQSSQNSQGPASQQNPTSQVDRLNQSMMSTIKENVKEEDAKSIVGQTPAPPKTPMTQGGLSHFGNTQMGKTPGTQLGQQEGKTPGGVLGMGVGGGAGGGPAGVGGPGVGAINNLQQNNMNGISSSSQVASGPSVLQEAPPQKPEEPLPDPWALLDPHAVVGDSAGSDSSKFETGKTQKPRNDRLLWSAEQLLADKKLRGDIDPQMIDAGRSECDAETMGLMTQYYQSDTTDNLFQQAVPVKDKKLLTLQMGFSTELVKLEDIFVEEQRKRQALLREQKKLKNKDANSVAGAGTVGAATVGDGNGGGDGSGTVGDIGGGDDGGFGGGFDNGAPSVPQTPRAESVFAPEEEDPVDPFVEAHEEIEQEIEQEILEKENEQQSAVDIEMDASGLGAMDQDGAIVACTPDGGPMGASGGAWGSGGMRPENIEAQKKKIELERQLEDQERRYNLVIRSRLEEVTQQTDPNDAQNTIYQNVRKWTETLEPVLAEDQKRKEFNFNRYGEEMLKDLEKLLAVTGKTEATFDELAVIGNVPRWEADRLFLTVLVLANTGNVEIIKPEGGTNRDFTIKLLNVVPNRPALEAAGAPVPAEKTKKKTSSKKKEDEVEEKEEEEKNIESADENNSSLLGGGGGSKKSVASKKNNTSSSSSSSSSGAAAGAKSKTAANNTAKKKERLLPVDDSYDDDEEDDLLADEEDLKAKRAMKRAAAAGNKGGPPMKKAKR